MGPEIAIGLAVSALSAGASFVGAQQQAAAQKQIAENNQTLQEAAARDERIAAAQEAARARRQNRQQIARSEAAFAQSGSLFGSASDALIQERTALELDVEQRRLNRMQGASRMDTQARLTGDNYARGPSPISAAGQLLTSAGGAVLEYGNPFEMPDYARNMVGG